MCITNVILVKIWTTESETKANEGNVGERRVRGARGREEERKRACDDKERKIICQLQVDFSFDVE
jgi:hypothetical protein